MSEKKKREVSNMVSLISSAKSHFQQVPVNNSTSVFTTHNNKSLHSKVLNPYLKILIQPEEQFRFRYKSERVDGTHGYLHGENSTLTHDSSRTYPTVELKNYLDRAIIKYQLYQHNKDVVHPHKLLERGSKMVEVSPDKGYTVCFEGLGIIHTAKKDVQKTLKERMSDDKKNSLAKCKKIDFNRVRLRFSAHDVTTGEELCAVYSNTINNSKSAETNMLVIYRASRATGVASGGEGTMLFVEKVNKGNVRVNFFETNARGERGVWEAKAVIHEVHRQYGIFFSTPAYKDQAITTDAHVWMELQRETDGSRSRPIKFIYTPDTKHVLRNRKMPRRDDNVTLVNNIPNAETGRILLEITDNSSGYQSSCEANASVNPDINTEEQYSFSDLISLDAISTFNEPAKPHHVVELLDRPYVPPDPDTMPLGDIFNQTLDDPADFMEFLVNHRDPLLSEDCYDIITPQGPFMDECQNHQLLRLESDKPRPADANARGDDTQIDDPLDRQELPSQIHTLIKEIFELKKVKLHEWYEEMTDKLDKLYQIRLSNGDTILHMLALENEGYLRRLVELTSSLQRPDLLAARGAQGLTVLHHALLLDNYQLVKYLVERGCDPKWYDCAHNTVVHHAVRCGPDALGPLLQVMAPSCQHDKQKMKYKLLHTNDERQTPLHLAVQLGSAASVRLLLEAGCPAHHIMVDGSGREPLHIAVETNRPDLLQLLLDHTPSSAQANPCVSVNGRESACEAAQRAGGALWAALKPHCTGECTRATGPRREDTTSSEDEDFYSADEGDLETEDNDITIKMGAVNFN